MANARAPWYAAGITSILTAIGSGVAGYYASGAGSGAGDIRANEHRITQIEDSIVAHAQADALQRTDWQVQIGNLWCAIRVNHGEPCRGGYERAN